MTQRTKSVRQRASRKYFLTTFCRSQTNRSKHEVIRTQEISLCNRYGQTYFTQAQMCFNSHDSTFIDIGKASPYGPEEIGRASLLGLVSTWPSHGTCLLAPLEWNQERNHREWQPESKNKRTWLAKRSLCDLQGAVIFTSEWIHFEPVQIADRCFQSSVVSWLFSNIDLVRCLWSEIEDSSKWETAMKKLSFAVVS